MYQRHSAHSVSEEHLSGVMAHGMVCMSLTVHGKREIHSIGRHDAENGSIHESFIFNNLFGRVVIYTIENLPVTLLIVFIFSTTLPTSSRAARKYLYMLVAMVSRVENIFSRGSEELPPPAEALGLFYFVI